jgi:hypothetical protein
MSIEPVAEPELPETISVLPPFPKAWWGRVFYGLFVTVLPVLSFSSIELLKPDWQTGRLSDYVVMFLLPEASWFFFPLLAYSIVCYLLLLFAPARFSKSFIVRCGIYTGVLLALQYSVLAVLYALDSMAYAIIPVWIFPFAYSMIYRWAAAKWTDQKVNKILFLLIPLAILIASLITRGSAAFLTLIVLVMAAPFWSFLLAVQASIWLVRNYETRITLPRGLGLATWIAGYSAAWRFNLLKMYELYAALPPQPPPDCYIATAAAQGHPQFVGSWRVRRTNGEFMQVNKQLQILKCAELALMVFQPRLHKMLRNAYNVIGKSMAKRMRNPFLADVAYLMLKPGEHLARLLLKIVLPEIDLISNKMYTS